jgi:hypothetical protein
MHCTPSQQRSQACRSLLLLLLLMMVADFVSSWIWACMSTLWQRDVVTDSWLRKAAWNGQRMRHVFILHPSSSA